MRDRLLHHASFARTQYHPEDYVSHIRDSTEKGYAVVHKQVGSDRSASVTVPRVLILDVLVAIKTERPDLELHGFGLNVTALKHGFPPSARFSSLLIRWHGVIGQE